MREEVLEILKQYLLDHEDDIAIGINDFGELYHVFYGVVGREPEE